MILYELILGSNHVLNFAHQRLEAVLRVIESCGQDWGGVFGMPVDLFNFMKLVEKTIFGFPILQQDLIDSKFCYNAAHQIELHRTFLLISCPQFDNGSGVGIHLAHVLLLRALLPEFSGNFMNIYTALWKKYFEPSFSFSRRCGREAAALHICVEVKQQYV